MNFLIALLDKTAAKKAGLENAKGSVFAVAITTPPSDSGHRGEVLMLKHAFGKIGEGVNDEKQPVTYFPATKETVKSFAQEGIVNRQEALELNKKLKALESPKAGEKKGRGA